MTDLVERLRVAASNNRVQAERGTDTCKVPLSHAQMASKRAVAEMHDEAANAIEQARTQAIDDCIAKVLSRPGMFRTEDIALWLEALKPENTNV